MRASSTRTEGRAMIAATQIIPDHGAQRERCQTVWTTILKRYQLAVLSAVEYDRLSRDAAAQWRTADFGCPCSNVPLVFEEHHVAARQVEIAQNLAIL